MEVLVEVLEELRWRCRLEVQLWGKRLCDILHSTSAYHLK